MSFTAKDLSIGDNCFPCRPGVAAPNMKGGYPPEGLGDASPPYFPQGCNLGTSLSPPYRAACRLRLLR